MTTRRFPTEAEVDTWLAQHTAPADDPYWDTPAGDQAKAAAAEAEQKARQAIPVLVASGLARFGVIGGGPQAEPTTNNRAAACVYLAAASVGIRPGCPHVNQIRPFTLVCDPPTVICDGCLSQPGVVDRLMDGQFLFTDECDLCGASARMFRSLFLRVGGMQVVAHACRPCADGVEQGVLREAAEQGPAVVVVGRRRPCLCGSGRRFKNCCEGKEGRR
jgi:hypothetical protein